MTTGRSNGAPRTPAHAEFASRLRTAMERRGFIRVTLAERMGVSPTMVGYWRAGRYLPKPAVAERLGEVLDNTRLPGLVIKARTRRCTTCGVTFDRQQTRAMYCSATCQRKAHTKEGSTPDLRQEAIDAMCRGCEPEGTCRDDGCALRPFSPLLVVLSRRDVA